jgi:hypothetical protein
MDRKGYDACEMAQINLQNAPTIINSMCLQVVINPNTHWEKLCLTLADSCVAWIVAERLPLVENGLCKVCKSRNNGNGIPS